MKRLNIINLDSRKDRRASFMKQVLQHSIDATVWPGIVVKGKPFTGISQAYKQVVRHAKEQGLEYVILADDDFLLTTDDSWQYFLRHIPEHDWDIFLGGISGGNIIEPKNPEEHCTAEQWSGTFFFAVHKRFYDCFLMADENKNIDRWLSGIGLVEIEKILGRKPVYKVCNPLPVICMDSHSDNSGKFMEHKNYFAPYKLLK